MKITYSHLQTYFEKPLPSVEDVARTFTFGAFEIESIEVLQKVHGEGQSTEGTDWLIDVKVLPNRAHDCLSWVGIAREYAALTGQKMKHDPFVDPLPAFTTNKDTGEHIFLKIDDRALNPVHTLSYIRDVKVGPSPAWLREALEAVGQRSINNVVDATNYVMHEYGQPTHAFDAAKFETHNALRGVTIRSAKDGEKLTILGGKEYKVAPPTQLLTDGVSGDILDVAGVKGGTHAELTAATTEVIITSGKYNPANIRKTTQVLSLRTDASKRFENEIPDLLPFYGQKRVQELILEVAGGEVIETVCVDNRRGEDTNTRPVVSTLESIRGTLGSGVSNEKIVDTLTALSLAPHVAGSEVTVTPPWWRLDIEIPEDMVEEVGRVVGYDNVPATQLPGGRIVPQKNELFTALDIIRHTLCTAGFWEVSTYSLRDHGDIQLANALAEDKGYLRANLAEGISYALAQNEFHAPGVGVYDCLKLFEVGHVFTMQGGVRTESVHVCVGVRMLTGKKREEQSAALLHTTKQKLEEALGVRVHESVEKETFELDVGVAIQNKTFVPVVLPTVPHMRYAPLSHYPVALRDIAFWGTQTSDVYKNLIQDTAGSLLARIDLFDTFNKDGRTSYAYHLGFQSYEKTLTDADLVPVMGSLFEALQKAGCEIR